MVLAGADLVCDMQHEDLQPLTPRTATVIASVINAAIIQFTFFIVVFSFLVLVVWFSDGLH